MTIVNKFVVSGRQFNMTFLRECLCGLWYKKQKESAHAKDGDGLGDRQDESSDSLAHDTEAS